MISASTDGVAVSSSLSSSSLSSRVVPLVLLGLLAIPMGCTHVVNIKSEPPGAEIFVNGQSVGKAPVAYTETSSGGGTVEIKAKLNGQEAVQQVPKDQINWGAVAGAGGGGGAAACVALNAVGCVGTAILIPFAFLANCAGFAALVGGPLVAYFAAGQQMKDDITITIPKAGTPAGATTAPPATPPPPPPAYTPPSPGAPADQAY